MPQDLPASLIWFIIALVLGTAELLLPGVFLIFVAIAAAIMGVAMLALPGLPVIAQIIAFAVWAVVAVLVGKRWYRDYPVASADPLLNDRASRLIGEIATVEVAIDIGGGRVTLGDGSWPARGRDGAGAMAAGTRVRVLAVDGAVLEVEPVARLPAGTEKEQTA